MKLETDMWLCFLGEQFSADSFCAGVVCFGEQNSIAVADTV